MQRYSDIVVDKFGNSVEGAEVSVLDALGALAALFSDNVGTVFVNPTKTDANGTFSFYAVNGRYTIRVSGTGLTTREDPDIILQDPAQLLTAADILDDFVAAGVLPAVPAPVSLSMTTPTGTAYIQGKRVTPPATARAYTALKDTYVDLSSLGVYTYSEVANGAGAPAVAANSMRLFKAVTNATEVTAVTDLRALDLNVKSLNGVKINGGAAIKKIVRATASLDFASIPANTTADLTMAVVGAIAGSPVKLGVSAAPNAGLMLTAFCVANDVVTVRAANVTVGAIDPAAITMDAEVTNY